MLLKPEDALESRMGKRVKVLLNNGSELEGKLKTYDEYINIALDTGEGEVIIKGSKIRLVAFE